MRRRRWMLLLVVGLVVLVRPAGRRVQRVWHAWSAVQIWTDCKTRPASGAGGEPYAWLQLPEAGISQLVRNGQGRLDWSPGAESVGSSILIMAHRDTHFRRLGSVRPGHLVKLEPRGGRQQTFRCLETLVVDKDDATAFVQSQRNGSRLLLVTCYPFRYIGPAPQRFIVVCGPTGSGAGSCRDR